ncbi:MAG: type II toxin-antitoxin system VapC family toxin [Micropruina sp.]|nr:type II toxin-antitoxin system VapC family toxin [Micropruina sp.]
MILVDTDVLIAHLRGVRVARDWLHRARLADPLAVSVVTVAELTGGMRSGERAAVHRLLSAFRIEPVTEAIGRRAGEFMRQYRRSHTGIATADYLIAATADERGAALATLNVRHFPMLDDLQPPFVLD